MNDILNFTAQDMPDNTMVFSAEDIQPGESISKTARLFYVGKHKGRDFGKSDLAKIVDNFKPDEEIPLQLDHSKSARDTIGFPRKVWLSGDGTEIHGDLEFRGKDNVEKVRLGLWKKLSIGLGIKMPDMKMDHVAVTPFPALEGAAMFDNITKGDDNTMDPKTVEMAEFTKMKEDLAKQQEQLVEFAQFKEQYAAMEAEKKATEEQLRFANDEKHIETFCLDGKTTPGMKTEELALFHSLDETQRELFAAYKAKMPAFIDRNIYNIQKASKEGEGLDEKRVERLMQKS